ncbi:hypothetical protein JTB14_030181 [Gonioctena quinquepunctata]|nr:hypothetical protein JTB14_030181 [Gonioctena quinquepunctata]
MLDSSTILINSNSSKIICNPCHRHTRTTCDIKSSRKEDLLPEVPPTTTHPLYSASSQDPPKMAFYPTTTGPQSTKPPRDPWAREEQERQQEARREAARQWQEQQIRELASLQFRTPSKKNS